MSCPDCFKGSVHEGTPVGKLEEIHGLNTYVSLPKSGIPPKGIIVIIPDAFGIEFVNNRLLADHYAEKGDYKVYLPDFMAGWSAPVWMLDTIRVFEGDGKFLSKLYNTPLMLYALIPWLFVNRIGASYPRVKIFFEALRCDEPHLPVGAAGFCWGGKHVLLLAADNTRTPAGKPLLDAGYTGHPSLMTLPDDIENIRVPISFAIGDKDNHIPMNQVEKIKEIVEDAPNEYRGEVKVYPNCGHGFCIRADTRFEDVTRQAAAAEDQCIEWFNKHFK